MEKAGSSYRNRKERDLTEFTGNDKLSKSSEKKENRIMLERIKEIIADALGTDVSTLTAETSFKEDLGADSLDLFELVMALEEEYEVEIPSEDLEGIKTIGDVEAYIQRLQ